MDDTTEPGNPEQPEEVQGRFALHKPNTYTSVYQTEPEQVPGVYAKQVWGKQK